MPPAAAAPESDRTAIVTGASSGLGVAIAEAFGGLGFRVAVGARRTDRLAVTAEAVERAGGRAFAHRLDVADQASIESFFDAVEQHWGVADVVVNNAGMNTPGPLHELPAEAVSHEVATNLLGPMHVCRRALPPLLAARRRGDLVFVSSDAVRNPRPRQAVYTATKCGLEALARTLGMELEGTGVRCTIVRPGPALSEYAASWEKEEIPALLAYWQRFGLQRHGGVMSPAAVARAVVLAVTTPPGACLDTIEVQPEAPVDG
jgi:NAD(P)-dependent dehydrogenase (short-subunit alcohol dehydrogenase family)